MLHDWIDMKLKIDSVRFEGNISIGRFQFQLKMLGYYRLSSSYADWPSLVTGINHLRPCWQGTRRHHRYRFISSQDITQTSLQCCHTSNQSGLESLLYWSKEQRRRKSLKAKEMLTQKNFHSLLYFWHNWHLQIDY